MKLRKSFSLVEMVTVIVLLGIVGLMGYNIISKVFVGYFNSKIAFILYYESKFAIERIDREMRISIPNSVSVIGSDNSSVRFVVFRDGGYYTKIDDTHIKNVDNGTVVSVGDIISIYNTSVSDIFSGTRVYSVTNIVSDNLTLDHTIAADSPYSKFYIIDSTVIFRYDSTSKRILRCSVSGVAASIADSSCKVLASKVGAVSFNYVPPDATHREGITKMNIAMSEADISLQYKHQVHIRNVP